MGTRTRSRMAFADNFSRGLDLFRLQALVQGRSIVLLIKVILLMSIVGVLAYTWWATREAVMVSALTWYAAVFLIDVLLIDIDGIPVYTNSGWRQWTAGMVRWSEWHVLAGQEVKDRFFQSTMIAMAVSMPTAFAIGAAAWWRGKNATAELLSRGQEAVHDHVLARIVRRRVRTSSFRIGRVPIPETALNRNFLFLGTTQTGKSVSLKRWLAEIERRGDLAIVFDKVGDFTETFYDPERGDVLLNPLDRRSPKWSPWAEMRETADAYRLARSLIPSVDGDNNFFHTAAQDLFAALLQRIGQLPNTSVQHLLEIALIASKEAKLRVLAGTSAAKHFQGKDNRAGQGVDATMAVFTQSLRFLPKGSGEGEDFSIRDFITDTVTALEAKPKAAVAKAIERQKRDAETLDTARRCFASGDYRGASKDAEHVLVRWPLLPKRVPAFDGNGAFAAWWEQHNEAVRAHWEAQDEERKGACERAIHDVAERAKRARKKGAPWLFIASNQRQLAALKPLISMQLDAVADTILSLEPNRKRRIWVIVDELASLQAIPSLPALLTECAKYGACVCVGVQNMGQLRSAYGRDTTETILSLFNTKAIFRMPEPDTAKWCESAIGQAVIERVHEGIRYGTSQTMDGAQLSALRTTEPIVMAGDIMRQPDLHLYLMLPGQWPVAQAQLRFERRRDARPARAEALVPVDPTTTIFDALDAQGFTPMPEGSEITPPEELSSMAIAIRPETDSKKNDDDQEDRSETRPGTVQEVWQPQASSSMPTSEGVGADGAVAAMPSSRKIPRGVSVPGDQRPSARTIRRMKQSRSGVKVVGFGRRIASSANDEGMSDRPEATAFDAVSVDHADTTALDPSGVAADPSPERECSLPTTVEPEENLDRDGSSVSQAVCEDVSASETTIRESGEPDPTTTEAADRTSEPENECDDEIDREASEVDDAEDPVASSRQRAGKVRPPRAKRSDDGA